MVPESPLERAVFRWSVLAYLVASTGFLVWYSVGQGAGRLAQLGGLALTSFVAMGKLVVFAGLSADAPSIWTLAAVLFAIDMGCAFLLASAYDRLKRVPRLGRWLERADGHAERALREYPGLRKLAFFGVIAFVLIPVAGTGAITGSLLARLLGLKRMTAVGAIAVASGASTLGFALLARFVGKGAEAFLRNPLLITLGTLAAVGLCWFAYQRILSRLRA